MTQSDFTVVIAAEALRQKVRARSNRSRRNVRVLAGFLVGFFGCGLMVYTMKFPQWRIPNLFTLCACVGACVGAAATLRMKQVPARCPVCSHDWKIKEGRSIAVSARMEGWDKCPGCGLHMADWALERAAAGKQPL